MAPKNKTKNIQEIIKIIYKKEVQDCPLYNCPRRVNWIICKKQWHIRPSFLERPTSRMMRNYAKKRKSSYLTILFAGTNQGRIVWVISNKKFTSDLFARDQPMPMIKIICTKKTCYTGPSFCKRPALANVLDNLQWTILFAGKKQGGIIFIICKIKLLDCPFCKQDEPDLCKIK